MRGASKGNLPILANRYNTKLYNWMKMHGDDIIKAPFRSRAMATGIQTIIEGFKMEIAMQDPLGLGGDPSEKAPLGSSFATGVGFGFAGSLIPWSKMWTGVTGNKAGAWKGMYDYLVAAPVNFTIGAKIGALSNAIVDDMLGNKTWNNFLKEEFGDLDHVTKHLVSDLIMGFGMKLGHFKKYDFTSMAGLKKLQLRAHKEVTKRLNNDGSLKKG